MDRVAGSGEGGTVHKGFQKVRAFLNKKWKWVLPPLHGQLCLDMYVLQDFMPRRAAISNFDLVFPFPPRLRRPPVSAAVSQSRLHSPPRCCDSNANA